MKTIFLLSFFSIIVPAFGEVVDKAAPILNLQQKLQGQWVLSGTPDKIRDAPKQGGRIKTIKGDTWEIVQKDPKTGAVIFRHGGTFTLKGDLYIESVKFANDNTKDLIGNDFKFKVKFKGEILLNHGQGNPWTEAWRRIK